MESCSFALNAVAVGQFSSTFSLSKGAVVTWQRGGYPLFLRVHVTNSKVVSLQQVVMVAHMVQQELSFGFSLQGHKTQFNQYLLFNLRRDALHLDSRFQEQPGWKGCQAKCRKSETQTFTAEHMTGLFNWTGQLKVSLVNLKTSPLPNRIGFLSH